MDQHEVPAVLREIATAPIELHIDADEASYFLSTIDLCRGAVPSMISSRSLLLATSRITADAAEYSASRASARSSSAPHRDIASLRIGGARRSRCLRRGAHASRRRSDAPAGRRGVPMRPES